MVGQRFRTITNTTTTSNTSTSSTTIITATTTTTTTTTTTITTTITSTTTFTTTIKAAYIATSTIAFLLLLPLSFLRYIPKISMDHWLWRAYKTVQTIAFRIVKIQKKIICIVLYCLEPLLVPAKHFY